MKVRILILFTLILVVFGLSYQLYRIEKRYLTPRVQKVEKEVIKKVGVDIAPEKVKMLAGSLKVNSRVVDEHLEVRIVRSRAGGGVDTVFVPYFVKGINFGPALPGSYPAEFTPERGDYARWLRLMGEAGFNAIRVYTLLPPDFYSALAAYNMKNSAHPIYLFQGIWVPVPENEDYLNKEFSLKIQREIEKVVDAIHGQGGYFVDVSDYTFGFIFGREWEPDGVEKTMKSHPSDTGFVGNFISIPRGNPMEIWLARMMDYIETYEAVRYRTLHPVSFVNWLTLDPLYHISEFIESERVREYDNDLFTVDPSRFYRTSINSAGFFASYHIYPYYPDFMNNEYGGSFEGYLKALKEVTDGLPILVAEFGVPSSRGIGHFNPMGLHQGGHSEVQQGIIDFMLFKDIFKAGYAGGILFEWMDEWFKRNWLFMDFENPMSRNHLWHNVYDAEQTFGLVSFDPGVIKIDGHPDDWKGISPLLKGSGRIQSFSVTSDPTFIYFKIELSGEFDPERETLRIFLDTYRKDLGEFFFPGKKYEFKNGTEFIIELSKRGKILVEKSYNVYRNWIYGRFSPMRTERRREGKFVEPALQANRERITLIGDTIPGRVFYPGRLIYGKEDDNSLVDWYFKGKTIEVRLGWNAINVTDPSSHHVLQNDPSTPEVDAVVTDGISFSVAIFDENGVADALPGFDGRSFKFSNRFLWKGWDRPFYRERLKQSYFVLKDSLSSLKEPRTEINEVSEGEIKILPFMGDYRGFVTFSFDDGDISQFAFAFPILEKYGAKGSFGIVTSWLSEGNLVAAPPGELKIRRMSRKQVKELSEKGHEITSHGHVHSLAIYNLPYDSLVSQFRLSKSILEKLTGEEILTFHMPYSRYFPKAVRAVKDAGFKYIRVGGNRYNTVNFDPYRIHSFEVYNDSNPSIRKYFRILKEGENKWIVIMNHHVLPESAFELQVMKRHGVKNTYSILPVTFERQVRIARDLGFRLVSIKEAAGYLERFKKARLNVIKKGDVLILSSSKGPVIVKIPLRKGIYRVQGSLNDGVYEVRKNPLILGIPGGKSVIISKVGT